MKFTTPLVISGLIAAAVLGGLVTYGVTRQSQPASEPSKQAPTPEPVPYVPPQAPVVPQPTPTPAPPVPTPTPVVNARTYRNDQVGFNVDFPVDTVLPTEDPNDMPRPICDPETAVVCMPYIDKRYDGTNLEVAGFSVDVLPKLADKTSCMSVQPDEQPDGVATIYFLLYRKFSTTQGAAGHQVVGERYRYFANGSCLQLSTAIATTNLDNAPKGTIKPFTDQDRMDVENVLEGMLMTFRLD